MSLRPPRPGEPGFQDWLDMADAVDAAGCLGAGVLASQEPVADASIKAAYVAAFGSDKGWLGIEGSYFIEGYREGRKAAAGVLGQDETKGGK